MYKIFFSLLVLMSATICYYVICMPSSLSKEELGNNLKEKVVLICGASSGIGEEAAYQLADLHVKIVIVARSEDKLKKVQQEAIKRGASAVEIVVYDFANVDNVGSIVNYVIEKFGKLDYLISNHAAMMTGAFLVTPYMQEPEYLQRIFKVNLLSHIELAVKALPHLEKTHGHMFFTSSMAGEMVFYPGSIYCSTKHAMNGFFYSLQQELIAKESSVSLTIGSLGYIITNEQSAISGDALKDQPKFLLGDLTECARAILESYVLRPATVTYPLFGGILTRFMWYFRDTKKFHIDMIGNFASSVKGDGTQYEKIQRMLKRKEGKG